MDYNAQKCVANKIVSINIRRSFTISTLFVHSFEMKMIVLWNRNALCESFVVIKSILLGDLFITV